MSISFVFLELDTFLNLLSIFLTLQDVVFRTTIVFKIQFDIGLIYIQSSIDTDCTIFGYTLLLCIFRILHRFQEPFEKQKRRTTKKKVVCI